MKTHSFQAKAAAIFDFDGTLVNSFACRSLAHSAVCDILLAYLEQEGIKSRKEKMLRLISQIEKEMALRREYDRTVWFSEAVSQYTGGRQKAPYEVLDSASLVYWNTVIANTSVYPHVEEVLTSLRQQGLLIGLLSDTDGRKGMKSKRIEHSGLRRFFDAVVVAGEDTPETKPQKQPFVKETELLSLQAEDCVYIGDDPKVDVAGAKGLGMRTIVIRNPRIRFKRTLPQADCIMKRESFGAIGERIFRLVEKSRDGAIS
jgi:putative hydrolase of the HAD superfamily